MNTRRPVTVLSKSLSTLLALGALGSASDAAVLTWDGGASSSALDAALNWSGDVLPSAAVPDTMQWTGTVAGPLDLSYTGTAFTGAAGNTGLNLVLTATQFDSVRLDAADANAFRMNGITIAAGAGPLTFGNGSGVFNLTLGGGPSTHTWTNNSSNPVTLASEVVTGLGGGGAHTLSLNGVGGYVFNNPVGQGNGTLTMTVIGNTTATFNATSTYTGANNIGGTGTTGVVRANANNALGTGTIVFGNNATSARLELLGGRSLSNAVTFAGRSTNTPAVQSVTGANTMSGTFTVGTGGAFYKIQSDLGSTLTLSGATAITSNATGTREVTLQGDGRGIVSGAIVNGTATIALTKSGAGTWNLNGANTYTGTTTVAGGTLVTTPAQTGATTVTVADGATFGVRLASAGTTFNAGTLNSGTVSGSSIFLDTGAFGNPTVPMINAATFNPNAATTLRLSGTGLAVALGIPLIDYTTLGGGGFGSLALALPARTIGSLVDNAIDGRVDLNITQLEQVKWKGNVDGNWDADTDGTGTSGTQNWETTVNSTATKYLQGTGGTDTANFTDSAVGNTSINITTALTPIGVNFDNSLLNYSLSSTGGFGIGGTAVVVKGGTGSVTFGVANTYSGGTFLNAGTLVLNNSSAIGLGTLAIQGGTLDSTTTAVLSTNNALSIQGDFAFAGSSDLDLGTGAATVAGAGAERTITVSAGAFTVGELRAAAHGVIKQGNGTLILSSTGTFAGNDGSRISGVLNVAAGTVQINRTGALLAVSGDLTTGGLTGTGTVTNGAASERWVYADTSSSLDFAGSLANGSGGALGFNKRGAGTQTLSGANSYTGATTVDAGTLIILGANNGAGTNATVNAGNLVLANTTPLGAASLIRLAGNAVSTLTFATDGGGTVYAFTQGTTTNSTIVSDRATPGVGINHTITTQTGANGVGGGTITFTSGANVTSGIGQITVSQLGLGAGSVQTTLLNPATAKVSVGDIGKANNNVSQTIELGGTSAGNEVTGVISNGPAIIAPNAISVNKSGSSDWTLSGVNTYTGPTNINAGTLNLVGSITGSSAVNVNAGTLTGNGTVTSVLNVGNGTGSLDAFLAPGVGVGPMLTGAVTFASDAVFSLEINTTTLTTDVLNADGAVSLGLGIATLNATDLGSAALNSGETFTFISSLGGVSGEFAGLPDGTVLSVGASNFEINYTATSVDLIAVVPEPGSAILLIGGVAMLGLRRKRGSAAIG